MALNFKAFASPGWIKGPSGVAQRASSVAFHGIIVDVPLFVKTLANSVMGALHSILGG